jgi:hypothetical protein
MAREEEGFFDELARGLADGSITRGKALRLVGAALVGGTLGSLGIGEAGADPPGCKREGKHCARTEQCCGTLVCVSGSCQTPTTTTTETPTTTTTETPTTTTTSTTSTTTTAVCPAGKVLLSNGTCALLCSGACPVCGSFGLASCAAEADTGRSICSGDSSGVGCTTTDDCQTGQFCADLGGPRVCTEAC